MTQCLLAKPIGDRNTASSRIRCFRFLEFMPNDTQYKIFDGSFDGDILYVQKDAYRPTIESIKCAIRNSIKVIYDLDDDFGVYPHMHEKEMIRLAQCITTDTDERAQYIRKCTQKLVSIIPDALDYVHDGDKPIEVRHDINNVVTFGSNGSVTATIPYINAIDRINVTYISQRPISELQKHKHITWSLDSFLMNLNAADVALLVHPDTDRGNMKSNNRLLVTMSIGLPTIVSNTCTYSQTMSMIGLKDFVVNSPSEVMRAINKLKDQSLRQSISSKMMEYAWKHYHPKNSSMMLLDLVRNLRSNHARHQQRPWKI